MLFKVNKFTGQNNKTTLSVCRWYCAFLILAAWGQQKQVSYGQHVSKQLIIHTSSSFGALSSLICSHNWLKKGKSCINLNSLFSLHQLLKEISINLAAKCSTVCASELLSVVWWLAAGIQMFYTALFHSTVCSPVHTEAAMQGASSLSCSVFCQSEYCLSWGSRGFEPAASRLLDNMLYLLRSAEFFFFGLKTAACCGWKNSLGM